MICPHCKSNLADELIYQTFLVKYDDHKKALETTEMYGATKTTGRWGRQISIYSLEKDRTIAYMCPDCKHMWPRN